MISKLKDYRKNVGLSQYDLAEQLDISVRTLQRYESGERLPSLDLIKKLESLLHTKIENIFIDDGEDAIAEFTDDQMEFYKKRMRNTQNEYTIGFFTESNITDNELHKIANISRYLFLLNDPGKEKAVEQVELLTKVPEYQRTQNEDADTAK
ncbi:helix-turn-helix transcriptional regulator [Eubacterium aggregans]|uniref:helix-turn-helix transcriptional regulator n=1 Tax=Eubacterium aggregans TaxID=81409 RepID=UPI003F3AA052